MAEKKVLAIVYACNPYRGSEEGVGWGWVNMIARSNEVWAIVADYHRNDIERYVREHPAECRRLHFCYVEHRPCHYEPSGWWLKIESSFLKPLMNIAYHLWQKDAYHLAQTLQQQVGFDLCHLITYVGFRFPGKFWKLDIPFVWGPIGGLENTPWRLLPAMGLYGMVFYTVRNVINSVQRVLLPGPKKAFAKAGTGVIAATEGMRKEINRWYGIDARVICEIGSPEGSADGICEREAGQELIIVWSGLFLPRKALPLLLKALARLGSNVGWRLKVLGDGPCRQDWERLAASLGLADRCDWFGQLPRGEAVSIMHNSHLFVISSLQDLTSTVILEALSQGVPVLCPDHCGFSDVITDDCGIKIPIPDSKRFVAALGESILELAQDESRRRLLAKGALQRASHFTWERKADQVASLYGEIMGENT